MKNSTAPDLNYLIDSVTTISCPICGCEEHQKVYRGPAFRGNLELTCVICTYCTHLYLNPRPSLEAYSEFYSKDDYGRLASVGKKKYSRSSMHEENYFQERTGQGTRLYNEYLKDILTENDIVFDFGAGDGAWLFGLRESSGCEINGNEPGLLHVEFIKKRMGLEIFYGSTEDLGDQIADKYKGKAKLAIVSGSLQHMINPMKCLSIARSILTEDGYLYICNWNLFDRMSLESENAILLRECISIDHPHYFHKNSYMFMVKKAGFEVLNFKPVSTIRTKVRHMEIFARKVPLPEKVLPELKTDEILSKIDKMESDVRRYRTFSVVYHLRFIKRKIGELVRIISTVMI